MNTVEDPLSDNEHHLTNDSSQFRREFELLKYEMNTILTFIMSIIIIIISTLFIFIVDECDIKNACLQIINTIISLFFGITISKKIS